MSNSWSTSSQPYALLVGEKQCEIAKAKICTHRVARKLVNSWPIPRQLPIPWEAAGVFLATVLWHHLKDFFHVCIFLFVTRYIPEKGVTYYEARNDYTNNLETVPFCNRCVCNWKIHSQTVNVCNWYVHSKPCVTDVLCNREVNSQIIKMCVYSFWAP